MLKLFFLICLTCASFAAMSQAQLVTNPSTSGSGGAIAPGAAPDLAVYTGTNSLGPLVLPTAPGLIGINANGQFVSASTPNADSYPTSCTVSSIAYTTQLDCAFYSLIAAGHASTLRLGNNSPYQTCAGLVEPPDGPLISIVGEDTGDNAFPSEIQQKGGCTPSSGAVIYKYGTATGTSTPYSLLLSNFNIDANNLANAIYVAGTKVGHIEHIHARNAIGPTAIQFGQSGISGTDASSYQMFFDDILYQGSGNGIGSWATLTPTQSGGTPSIAVGTGGTYTNSNPPAYLFGFGAGANPCTVMGTATAVMSGTGPYSVASVTLSGFSGCSGTMFAYVPDLNSAIQYGFYTDAVTDSTFKDIVVAGAGSVAGIYEGGGDNTWIHSHPYGAMPILEEHANASTWIGPELDSPIHYGMALIGAVAYKGQVIGATLVWGGQNHPNNGAVGFYSAGNLINLYGSVCNGVIVNSGNNWNLLAGTNGPISTSTGSVFLNGTVINAQQCDTLATANTLSNLSVSGTVLSSSDTILPNASATSGNPLYQTSSLMDSKFWDGSVSQTVGWQWQNLLPGGTTPTAVLNLSQSGTATNPQIYTSAAIQSDTQAISQGSTIASATTIAPTRSLQPVSGSAAITTITPWSVCLNLNTTGDCTLVLQAAAGSTWSLATGGNVGANYTSTAGSEVTLHYNTSTSLWYPGGSVNGGVLSFNSRTGAVVPASADYSVAQVTGAAPIASPTLTGTGSGLYKGYAVDTGTANAYAVTLGDSAYTGTVAGAFFFFKPANTSNASSTMVINSGSARTLQQNAFAITNDILANAIYLAIDNGTQIEVFPVGSGGMLNVTDTKFEISNSSSRAKQAAFSTTGLSANRNFSFNMDAAGTIGLYNSETIASSTTPTFTINTLQSYNVLTANVTSFTLAAGADGQPKTLTFCQNATGSFTVAAPTNVHGFFTVGATASKCSVQPFIYSISQTAWLATSPGVINQ